MRVPMVREGKPSVCTSSYAPAREMPSTVATSGTESITGSSSKEVYLSFFIWSFLPPGSAGRIFICYISSWLYTSPLFDAGEGLLQLWSHGQTNLIPGIFVVICFLSHGNFLFHDLLPQFLIHLYPAGTGLGK